MPRTPVTFTLRYLNAASLLNAFGSVVLNELPPNWRSCRSVFAANVDGMVPDRLLSYK